MASYHFSAQVIKRSGGRSAVAAAAYRAGERLQDDRAETVHDYSKRGGVAHTEIMLPEGADARLADRETLWNEVEDMERRKDAQLAREINMALPHELTDEQRLELVRAYVQAEFVDRGMVADVAIHAPQPEKGDHKHNHHAHVMLTLRQADRNGLRKTKTREWNSRDMIAHWRQSWANYQNRALEQHHHRDRVDHRTLEAQRKSALERGDRAQAALLDREPEIHVGPKSRQMEQRGYTPKSKTRQVPVYGKERQQRRFRQRHYNGHDRGTRFSWNRSIIDGNRKRTAKRVLRTRAQQARFRQKQRYWGQRGHLLARQHQQRKSAGLVKKARRGFIISPRQKGQESMFTGLTLQHAKKRQSLLSRLLEDVGQALALMVSGQNRMEARYRDFGLRYQPLMGRKPVRRQARGRQRTRPLPGGLG
ncbi:MAG TPA: hypothetical protein ENJ30_02920 [Desulfobulbaceae bacterium]|nr:hypothetical protein [Desulfobulbaceae bacterium]